MTEGDVFLFTISLFKLLFLPEDFNNPQLEKKIKNSKILIYFFKRSFVKKVRKKEKQINFIYQQIFLLNLLLLVSEFQLITF